MKKLSCIILIALFTLISCSDSSTSSASNISVESISLNKSTASIPANRAEQLTATITPTNATNQSVTWSTSNSGIAVVDTSGLVIGVSTGTSIITVTTDDGDKTANCVVTITPAVFNVTYDGNGNDSGDVPIDTTNYEQGDSVTVLANTDSLARDGYTFVGWNTEDDGSGDDYDSSGTDSFLMNISDVTLYAQWIEAYDCDLTVNYTLSTGGTVDSSHMLYIQVSDINDPYTILAEEAISSYSAPSSITFEGIDALSVCVTMFHDADGLTATDTAPDDTNYAAISSFVTLLSVFGQLSEDDPYISYNDKATLPVNSTTGGETADTVTLTDGNVTSISMTLNNGHLCPEVSDILLYIIMNL